MSELCRLRDPTESARLCAKSMSARADIELTDEQISEYIRKRMDTNNQGDEEQKKLNYIGKSDQELLYTVLTSEQREMFKFIFRHIRFDD